MVRITILIIIKDGILILILITIRRVASVSLLRGMLFNMLKLSDQSIDTAHHLIELPIDVGVLVINKFLSSSLETHSLKSEGDSPPFPDPVMVRRQQKTTPRYYPYQLTSTG